MNEIIRFFHDVDRKDWPAIRNGLTDPLETDYTSLFGGEPERLAADEMVDRWRALLPGFDVTQHLLGPIAVTGSDGDAATCECNVRAYHRLGGRVWMVAGRYTLTVRGGRVAGIVLHTLYEEGDRGLVEEATERAGR
jgi:SnoaL-like domain